MTGCGHGRATTRPVFLRSKSTKKASNKARYRPSEGRSGSTWSTCPRKRVAPPTASKLARKCGLPLPPCSRSHSHLSRCVLHHGAINKFPGHQPYLFLTQEAEAIFVWYPGLYFLSYSLCPHCRNPACPSEYHDGHELATSKGMKCKSCNKEVPVQYLIKPH